MASELECFNENINAQVIAVFPDKVKIVVENLEIFKIAEESLKGKHSRHL
jgi:hypothetical protein